MLDHVEDPLLHQVRTLYRERDAQLYNNLERGLKSRRIAEAAGIDDSSDTPFVRSFRGAGRLVAAPAGPRIAVLSVHGWDTHINQGSVDGKLSVLLDELDYGLGAFKVAAGPAWANTVVTIVTEFGRTVRINGDEGTDHGIATVALLAGGAVNGRRVIADWPGLATSKLYQARDLKPTIDLRSLFKGVLRDHLGVPNTIINNTVFPDSLNAPSLNGLIKTN